MSSYRPLLASYGGGHVQIIAAVARAMIARNITPKVIGFTTAYRSLLRAGVPAVSVEDLIEPDTDAIYLEAVKPFVASQSHPDVTNRETQAYFALGLRDLVEQHGWQPALDAVLSRGRKAFEPISTMKRYLGRMQPDIVITTTSPRFELAMLKAARRSAIPTLAIGDLFLTHEREYILGAEYAEYLAVLSEEVWADIHEAGFAKTSIRVTGNPAFDVLAPTQGDAQHRSQLRAKLGLTNKTVILWPLAGATTSIVQKPFHTADVIAAAMEELCHSDESFSYILRPHPNSPLETPSDMSLGLFDNGILSLNDALAVTDVVCFETSTVGLQAALRGIPTISVGFSETLPYVRYGLATAAQDLDDAIRVIRTRSYGLKPSFKMPSLGSASSNVLSFIDDILANVN